MTYRVFWAPPAERWLESNLRESPDVQLLANAATEIDRHLLTNPHDFGESRYDAMRIGFIWPLGVQFEIMDDVCTVIVHDIWRIDRKSDGSAWS